jgi:hypothetical protein
LAPARISHDSKWTTRQVYKKITTFIAQKGQSPTADDVGTGQAVVVSLWQRRLSFAQGKFCPLWEFTGAVPMPERPERLPRAKMRKPK